jgi:hypothetical protein
MMVFGTFEVSANPRPESYVPFSCCSVQKQKSAAKSIFEILLLLNRLENRIV